MDMDIKAPNFPNPNEAGNNKRFNSSTLAAIAGGMATGAATAAVCIKGKTAKAADTFEAGVQKVKSSNIFTTCAAKLRDFATGALNYVRKGVGNVFGSVKGFVSKKFAAIKEGISAKYANFRDGFSNFIKKFTAKKDNLDEKITQATKEVAAEAVETLEKVEG